MGEQARAWQRESNGWLFWEIDGASGAIDPKALPALAKHPAIQKLVVKDVRARVESWHPLTCGDPTCECCSLVRARVDQEMAALGLPEAP